MTATPLVSLLAWLSLAVWAPSCAWAQPQEVFEYHAGDWQGLYDPATGVGEITVTPTISEVIPASGVPTNSSGFSMVLTHDNTVVLPVSVDLTTILLDMDNFTGPDFFAPTITDEAVIVGIVYDYFGDVQLSFRAPVEVLEIQYQTQPMALQGDFGPILTPLVFVDGLSVGPGNPPVGNIVSKQTGFSVEPVFQHGSIEWFSDEPFVRGDVNGSGVVSIPDVIVLLNQLFVPGAQGTQCEKATDVDDDDSVNLSDVIYLLGHILIPGSPAPPAPFPGCGADFFTSPLTCTVGSVCP